jgi:hypothetical protein
LLDRMQRGAAGRGGTNSERGRSKKFHRSQRTELLILKGAKPILKHFKYIKTEAADFKVYKDCANEKELCKFLAAHGPGTSALLQLPPR